MSESYTGVQKAAILLITLGPDKAATIFKHLKEDEIEELTLVIENTRSVSHQKRSVIRYAARKSTLPKVVSDKPWNFWKKHLEATKRKVLLQN